MNIEELRRFCLCFKGAEESFPFGDKILVFSVYKKMFCLVNIDLYEFINVKCDPEEAVELRERYSEVTEGYHMNKKHWNSVKTTGKITDKQIKKWILNSYHLVVAGLPKKTQKELTEE